MRCLGSFTSDGFVIAFPGYSPFSSLSCIAVYFLRTRTNVVPIMFSINISQNLFSDPDIISRPCLPNQIQGFLWGPVPTPALREVFLACTPLTILPAVNHSCSHSLCHTHRSHADSGPVPPTSLHAGIILCLQKEKMASHCSRIIANMSFWSSLLKPKFFESQDSTDLLFVSLCNASRHQISYCCLDSLTVYIICNQSR